MSATRNHGVTLRKAAGQVRRVLKDLPCSVKGETVSFEGFGYGTCGFVECRCDEPIPPEIMGILKDLDNAYKQAIPRTKIVISLGGKAYPFGGTVKYGT
jgi:hypothetical protein